MIMKTMCNPGDYLTVAGMFTLDHDIHYDIYDKNKL